MISQVDLAGFFPPGIEFELQPVHLPSESETSPAERALVKGASPKRQREFLSGRAAARRALARLGVEAYDLLSGSAREPIWPPQLIGSISHTAEFCIVATAPRARVTALGLDCEPDDDLDEGLWARVCTPAEREWLWEQESEYRGRWARLIFCAKEAAYKYQHPLTHAFLGFQDLSVIPDAREQTFTLQPKVPNPLKDARGSWRRAAGLLVCLVLPTGR